MARPRALFNYGYSAGLIDKPVRYGPAFKAPSEKAIRRVRNGNGLKMFEVAEIHTLPAAAAADKDDDSARCYRAPRAE